MLLPTLVANIAVVETCAAIFLKSHVNGFLSQEHHLYVDVVAALCEDRITWRDDGVPLIQSKEDPNQYC